MAGRRDRAESVGSRYAGSAETFPRLKRSGLGVLSESWMFAGEGHAVCELEEGVVYVVAYFPADS